MATVKLPCPIKIDSATLKAAAAATGVKVVLNTPTMKVTAYGPFMMRIHRKGTRRRRSSLCKDRY